MAEKETKFTTTVESLFKGMDSFISAKTVVGDVVHVNDTIIVPLVDVSFGVAAGAWEKTDKNSAGGGMGRQVKAIGSAGHFQWRDEDDPGEPATGCCIQDY